MSWSPGRRQVRCMGMAGVHRPAKTTSHYMLIVVASTTDHRTSTRFLLLHHKADAPERECALQPAATRCFPRSAFYVFNVNCAWILESHLCPARQYGMFNCHLAVNTSQEASYVVEDATITTQCHWRWIQPHGNAL